MFFWVMLPALLFAGTLPPEVLQSDKDGGDFVSSIKVQVNASYEQAENVLERFVTQYKECLDSLFDWALTGLDLQGEDNRLIMVNLKSHHFNPETGLVAGEMDLCVPILRQKFPDTRFVTRIDLHSEQAGHSTVSYAMTRCEKIIEHVDASLEAMLTADGKTELHFNARFKTTMPYNLMSKKQYRENVEWRFVQFVSNLRDAAEKYPEV